MTTPHSSYAAGRSTGTWLAATAAAGLLTVMLLAQLYSYEDFPTVLGELLWLTDVRMHMVAAASIVLVELMALPYLLGMYLSPLMRGVSAVAALAASVFWLLTALTSAHAGNAGLLSTTLAVPGGLVSAAAALLLFGLIAAVCARDTHTKSRSS